MVNEGNIRWIIIVNIEISLGKSGNGCKWLYCELQAWTVFYCYGWIQFVWHFLMKNVCELFVSHSTIENGSPISVIRNSRSC